MELQREGSGVASTRPALSRDRTSTVPITTQQIYPLDFPLTGALVQD